MRLYQHIHSSALVAQCGVEERCASSLVSMFHVALVVAENIDDLQMPVASRIILLVIDAKLGEGQAMTK
jgi:hypothetical protein